MAHVAEYKKKVVTNLTKLLVDYPIIGALNMENLPAGALQKMRASLRGKAEILMTKRRLMRVAFEEAEKQKKGVLQLYDKLRGMPALLFTKDNPFTIYKTLKKSKSQAPAKAGNIAPMDISVQAGPTPFLPGPIIGELGQFGIKTGVENGKVAIKADKVVVKEGEEINAKLAGLLTRLGIQPMEIGLDLTAVYEEGIIYDRKILDVDEDEFLASITSAAVYARNLAFDIAFPVKEFMPDMIGKAFREAKAIGIECNILEKEIIPDLLAKANAQCASLKKMVN